MPAVPSCLLEPIWSVFNALLPQQPTFHPNHPLGCHRRRIPDRVIFDHIIAALVHGSGHERLTNPGCSDRTIRRRLKQWAVAGHSPVDRGKQGRKRSVAADAAGILLGLVAAGANRNDSPLLAPTLHAAITQVGTMPKQVTAHRGRGCDNDLSRARGEAHRSATHASPGWSPGQSRCAGCAAG